MDNWLTVSQTAGTGNATITVTASSHTELTSRVSNINISGGSAYNYVLVTQLAYRPEPYFGLTFEIISGGTIVFKRYDYYTPDRTIEYSLNYGEWTSITTNQTNTINVSEGDIIWFRGNNSNLDGNCFMDSTAYFNISGNICSLLDADNFQNITAYQDSDSHVIFPSLFRGTNVIDASQLVLSVTGLTRNCYASMFSGCTSLVAAPELPSTNMEYRCYRSMFEGCTSLETAPELPATSLWMYCYQDMFKNCSNLNYAKCLATDISSSDAYDSTLNWLSGVSPTGTFVKNPNMNDWTTGASGIPSGWTVIDAT